MKKNLFTPLVIFTSLLLAGCGNNTATTEEVNFNLEFSNSYAKIGDSIYVSLDKKVSSEPTFTVLPENSGISIVKDPENRYVLSTSNVTVGGIYRVKATVGEKTSEKDLLVYPDMSKFTLPGGNYNKLVISDEVDLKDPEGNKITNASMTFKQEEVNEGSNEYFAVVDMSINQHDTTLMVASVVNAGTEYRLKPLEFDQTGTTINVRHFQNQESDYLQVDVLGSTFVLNNPDYVPEKKEASTLDIVVNEIDVFKNDVYVNESYTVSLQPRDESGVRLSDKDAEGATYSLTCSSEKVTITQRENNPSLFDIMATEVGEYELNATYSLNEKEVTNKRTVNFKTNQSTPEEDEYALFLGSWSFLYDEDEMIYYTLKVYRDSETNEVVAEYKDDMGVYSLGDTYLSNDGLTIFFTVTYVDEEQYDNPNYTVDDELEFEYDETEECLVFEYVNYFTKDE